MIGEANLFGPKAGNGVKEADSIQKPAERGFWIRHHREKVSLLLNKRGFFLVDRSIHIAEPILYVLDLIG